MELLIIIFEIFKCFNIKTIFYTQPLCVSVQFIILINNLVENFKRKIQLTFIKIECYQLVLYYGIELD